MYCWGFILGRVCKRYSLGCFKGNQDIQFLCTSTEGALIAAKRRILSVGSTEHHKQCWVRFHPHVLVLCPCNTSVWECLCLNWSVFPVEKEVLGWYGNAHASVASFSTSGVCLLKCAQGFGVSVSELLIGSWTKGMQCRHVPVLGGFGLFPASSLLES